MSPISTKHENTYNVRTIRWMIFTTIKMYVTIRFQHAKLPMLTAPPLSKVFQRLSQPQIRMSLSTLLTEITVPLTNMFVQQSFQVSRLFLKLIYPSLTTIPFRRSPEINTFTHVFSSLFVPRSPSVRQSSPRRVPAFTSALKIPSLSDTFNTTRPPKISPPRPIALTIPFRIPPFFYRTINKNTVPFSRRNSPFTVLRTSKKKLFTPLFCFFRLSISTS